MGRMLSTLNQRAFKNETTAEKPTLHTVWPDSETDESTMPYIEVGDGETRMSTSLEATRPGSTTNKLPSSWMSVRFHPLPVERGQAHGLASFAPELIAFHDPEHAISHQYRELLSSLLLHLPSEQPRALMFTGSQRHTGTSTVLLNAAITLTQQGSRKVLVLDANLRSPSVSTRLGLPLTPGLAELLEDRVPLESALQETGVEGLTALTAGKGSSPLSLRLFGERMRALLETLREEHDLILIDGPYWSGRPDVVTLGSLSDAVYLCMPESEQETPEAQELMEIIPEQGANLRGCIVTTL